MTKYQSNKFTMYKAIDAFLDENRDKISSIIELENSCTAFNSKCEDLKAKNEIKHIAAKGKVASKAKMRRRAIDSSLGISAGLFTLGKRNDDDELSSITDIPKSDLEKLRDSELIETLQTLGAMAEARSLQLVNYGITPSKLESYIRSVNSYDDAFGKKITGVTKRKIASETISIHFNEGDEILKVIDKLIAGMQPDDPEFAKQYKDLRVIRHYGLRHQNNEPMNTDEEVQSLPVQTTGDIQSNSPPGTGGQ